MFISERYGTHYQVVWKENSESESLIMLLEDCDQSEFFAHYANEAFRGSGDGFVIPAEVEKFADAFLRLLVEDVVRGFALAACVRKGEKIVAQDQPGTHASE